MSLQDYANIAAIGGFVLFAILVLIDRGAQMIKWGKPYLLKIALASLILAVIGAGVSLYAAWYIKPPTSEDSVVSHKEPKGKSEEMTAFAYEEIRVPPDKAVELDAAKLKVMETSSFSYSARIMVEDAAIAFLETGDIPTGDTKQILYPDSTLIMKSIADMKQFKAIGKGGTATLAVTYYRSNIQSEERPIKTEQRQAIKYYLVSKDGTIKTNGIDQYGLFVKKEDKEETIGAVKYMSYKYILRFKTPPSNIDVTTQEGAIPTVKRINTNVYEVIFHSAEKGFMGSPIVECNFKIQVY